MPSTLLSQQEEFGTADWKRRTEPSPATSKEWFDTLPCPTQVFQSALTTLALKSMREDA